ncbi:DUF5412 family protein [Paenalkalicoccus suaedae]|nr:DUF5412 family protein [Paenalkalicoccus suaedae]
MFIALLSGISAIMLFGAFGVRFAVTRRFPRRILIATLSSLLIMICSYWYFEYMFTFDSISRGNMEEVTWPIVSPDETYVAIAYTESLGGAAGAVSVVVEVTNSSAEETSVIYYALANSRVSLDWVGDHVLQVTNEDYYDKGVNRSVTLDVRGDIYDERGRACKSYVMKGSFDMCYQHKRDAN